MEVRVGCFQQEPTDQMNLMLEYVSQLLNYSSIQCRVVQCEAKEPLLQFFRWYSDSKATNKHKLHCVLFSQSANSPLSAKQWQSILLEEYVRCASSFRHTQFTIVQIHQSLNHDVLTSDTYTVLQATNRSLSMRLVDATLTQISTVLKQLLLDHLGFRTVSILNTEFYYHPQDSKTGPFIVGNEFERELLLSSGGLVQKRDFCQQYATSHQCCGEWPLTPVDNADLPLAFRRIMGQSEGNSLMYVWTDKDRARFSLAFSNSKIQVNKYTVNTAALEMASSESNEFKRATRPNYLFAQSDSLIKQVDEGILSKLHESEKYWSEATRFLPLKEQETCLFDVRKKIGRLSGGIYPLIVYDPEEAKVLEQGDFRNAKSSIESLLKMAKENDESYWPELKGDAEKIKREYEVMVKDLERISIAYADKYPELCALIASSISEYRNTAASKPSSSRQYAEWMAIQPPINRPQKQVPECPKQLLSQYSSDFKELAAQRPDFRPGTWQPPFFEQQQQQLEPPTKQRKTGKQSKQKQPPKKTLQVGSGMQMVEF